MKRVPQSFAVLGRIVLALGLGAAMAGAQVVTVPATPVVGSSNPATAEPPVPRPSTAPCTVTLFTNEAFNDYSAHALDYAPPAGCKAPWARVVLTIDFKVSAGIQYDRTASLYLGNANIFYGTTAEPDPVLSPSWHVERDVTDLSAIFKTAQSGQAIIYNIVNSTYTGVIYGTAKLLFYPANLQNPAPVVPDVVLPVSGANSPYELDTTASAVTAKVTSPRNTARAYLDVIAQSQSNDEFWYFCVPNSLAAELESCGNTAFRETEVTIDGQPAGVAPVYPWIYTGGLDPNLWSPITGLQTLNFKPYRVDLTPFAGVLSDGEPHTVGVSVYNADSYFLATANLLLYEDHERASTGGALLEDSLSAEPTPQVLTNLQTDSSGDATGTVTVESTRTFTVRGYVNSSLGRVETTVLQTVDFNNTQTFDITAAADIQNAVQLTTVNSRTSTQTGLEVQVSQKTVTYPFTVDYAFVENPDGSLYQQVTANQQDIENESQSLNGLPIFASSTDEQVKSTDKQSVSASGVYSVGPTNSSAAYVTNNSLGQCYSRNIASVSGVLTSVTDGTGCSTKK